MVKIGYGSPNLIIANIGIFLELFDPIRIVLLGQLKMELPEAKDVIIRINLDIVGVLDFEKKELSFQASLYDSGIKTWKIFGHSAFFLSWGAQPAFAMSLGGFHPKFTPPPPPIIFSDLRRLGLDLSSDDGFELVCNAYFALTPNSLQFGARADLFVAMGALEVSGYMGFDALFYFSPFSFLIDVRAAMLIVFKGASLADVRVALMLSGPSPWNARGTATVKILFFDVDVDFNIIFGHNPKEFPNPVDPWPKLKEALERTESWGSRLPAGVHSAESLRKIEEEPQTEEELDENKAPPPLPIRVSPVGALEIRQNVAPLEIRLDKFGNAPVIKYDYFRIDSLTLEGQEDIEANPVEEFFARGQFENLTEQQKLSLPSFEKMPGGATTTSSNPIKTHGEQHGDYVRYESIVIASNRVSVRPKDDADEAEADWSTMQALSLGSAARRSALRSSGNGRYAHRDAGLVATAEEKYKIVQATTLVDATTLLVEGEIKYELVETELHAEHGMTRSQADQALAEHLLLYPDHEEELLVVAEYEVEEATS